MDPPQDINDIFSLSDDVLAEKLTFIEEVPFFRVALGRSLIYSLAQIGNGNWGSVWRCKPKTDPSAATAEDFDKVLRPHIAVKVVHRETKSKTSVARVKSLYAFASFSWRPSLTNRRQMERNEDHPHLQERPPSIHCSLLFLHHYPIVCSYNDVRISFVSHTERGFNHSTGHCYPP